MRRLLLSIVASAVLVACGSDDLSNAPAAPVDGSIADAVSDAGDANALPDANDARGDSFADGSADARDEANDGALDEGDANDTATPDDAAEVDAPPPSPGTLDHGFGTNGLSCGAAPGVDSTARTLSVLDDDSIVLLAGTTRVVLARYLADGALDPTFGTNGFAVLSHAATTDSPFGLTRLDDGRWLVATTSDPTGAHPSLSFARVSADGVLDTTFGANGFLGAAVGADVYALDLLRVGDRLLVSGFEIVDTRHLGFLARFGLDGVLDPTFGSNGVTTFSFGLDPTTPNLRVWVSQLSLSGSLILAGGFTYDPTRTTQLGIGVSCFTPDGTLDTTFGSNGAAYTGLVDGSSPLLGAMVTRGDGSLLLAGASVTKPGFFEALLLSYGPVDLTYRGVGETFVGDGAGASAILLQDDGKAIFGGAAAGGGFRLDRALPSGDDDLSFGTSGSVVTRAAPGTTEPGLDEATALAHEGSGKILAFGGATRFCLARYFP